MNESVSIEAVGRPVKAFDVGSLDVSSIVSRIVENRFRIPFCSICFSYHSLDSYCLVNTND